MYMLISVSTQCKSHSCTIHGSNLYMLWWQEKTPKCTVFWTILSIYMYLLNKSNHSSYTCIYMYMYMCNCFMCVCIKNIHYLTLLLYASHILEINLFFFIRMFSGNILFMLKRRFIPNFTKWIRTKCLSYMQNYGRNQW